MIDFDNILEKMKEETHTIHSIVSPLVANDMANILLSLNQAPFMAEYKNEVYEVTKNSHALLINLGTFNENKLIAMGEALKSARNHQVPVVLDPVGASATKERLETSLHYLKKYPISVLKGNYSELYSIYHKDLSTRGVDSHAIDLDEIIAISKNLSSMYNTVVVATGKEDVICGGDDVIILKNGSPYLSKVTGTGCIAGSLISACYSFENSIEAIVLALSILNISSELANKDSGMGTFKVSLIDEISLIETDKIKERINYDKL